VAYVVGFGGGKERGLQMIEEAATYESDAQTEARLALVLLYNREKRYTDALRVLEVMKRLYPRNRLLWLEEGATALRGGQAARAEAALTEGLSRLARDRRSRMFAEESLWRYKRGAARVALGRRADAIEDLKAALAAQSTGWIRGRTETEIGKLADLAGDRTAARAAYERAVQLCEADNDPLGAGEARRLSDTPYRP
jgi:tetratricopeptide (TPR) repeat protein